MQAAQDGRLVCYCGVTVVAAHKHPPPPPGLGSPFETSLSAFSGPVTQRCPLQQPWGSPD
jgi:hypothetical protein